MGNPLRIVSWNIQGGTGQLAPRANLLHHLDEIHGPWDVLCVQELPPRRVTEFEKELGRGHPMTGRAFVWPHEPGRDFRTRTAAAIFVRAPWTIDAATPLNGAPSPKRALVAELSTTGGRRLSVASAALPPAGWAQGDPPGEGWGPAKAEQARLLAAWIQEQRRHGPVLVGIDANAPRHDPPEWAQVTWWWDDEALLLGEGARLDLFRLWVLAHPEDLERIRRLRPAGPMVATYLRGQRGSKVPCRYDHILGAEVEPVTVGHIVDDALAAGSDHALVYADVTIGAAAG